MIHYCPLCEKRIIVNRYTNLDTCHNHTVEININFKHIHMDFYMAETFFYTLKEKHRNYYIYYTIDKKRVTIDYEINNDYAFLHCSSPHNIKDMEPEIFGKRLQTILAFK